MIEKKALRPRSPSMPPSSGNGGRQWQCSRSRQRLTEKQSRGAYPTPRPQQHRNNHTASIDATKGTRVRQGTLYFGRRWYTEGGTQTAEKNSHLCSLIYKGKQPPLLSPPWWQRRRRRSLFSSGKSKKGRRNSSLPHPLFLSLSLSNPHPARSMRITPLD